MTLYQYTRCCRRYRFIATVAIPERTQFSMVKGLSSVCLTDRDIAIILGSWQSLYAVASSDTLVRARLYLTSIDPGTLPSRKKKSRSFTKSKDCRQDGSTDAVLQVRVQKK